MANILDILNEIGTAIYGRDVRQAIIDAIRQCYEDGKAGVNDLQARTLIEAMMAVNEQQAAEIETLTARVEELEEGGSGGSSETTTTSVPTFLVESGTATFENVGANKTATQSITFTENFTEAPTVLAIKVFRQGANTFYSQVTAQPIQSSVTATGFTLAIGNKYTQAVSPSVLWVAFQPTTVEVETEITTVDGMTEADVRALLAPITAALNNLKIGYDGTEYDTPGASLREQINALHVLIGDEPGTAISASAVAYGEDGNVEDALDGLNERLDQYDDIFTGDVEESVQNWLDEHPEATTTVEDGSLTEAKFTESLKLKSIKEYFTPEMFGAVGDGVTDDISYIETMLNSVPDNAECVFYKNYYISRGVNVSRPVNIMMYGTLKVAPNSEYCVRISGHDVRRNRFRLNLAVNSTAESQWNGTFNTIGLDCFATWENEFDVTAIGFNTGIRVCSTNNDCTYNKFFIRSIYNCKTGILLTGDENLSGGTTSQNTFIGGRIGAQGSSYTFLNSDDVNDYYAPLKSILVGGRTNNNNNFISCSFEGYGAKPAPYENRAKVIANMNYCALVGCRYEGITEFMSQPACAVISGFGFDQINNSTYKNSAIGTYGARISSYTKPVILKRTGNTGDYLKIQDYKDRDTFLLDSDYYANVRGVAISASNKALFNDSGRLKLLSTLSNANSFTANNGEIYIGNPGYIKHKNSAGTVYVYEPIRTVKPSATSNLVTGMTVFANGKPQWWDGTQWVYADGTPVPTT